MSPILEPTKTDVPEISIQMLLDTDPDEAFDNHLHKFTTEDIEYSCMLHLPKTLQLLKMKPTLLDQFRRVAPGAALMYASHMLSAVQFADCVSQDPGVALCHVPDRLMPEQLVRLASAHVWQMEWYLSYCSDSKLLITLIPLLEKLDPVTRAVVSRAIAERI